MLKFRPALIAFAALTILAGSARADFAKPTSYIGGRLICAKNVNAALAAAGRQGTGSNFAGSFRAFPRVTDPAPGDVAYNGRHGGGHAAIVSRVDAEGIHVWNPGPHGQGWQEMLAHRGASFHRPPGSF